MEHFKVPKGLQLQTPFFVDSRKIDRLVLQS